MSKNESKPPKTTPFRKKNFNAYIGKRVLIGLTYYEHDGTFAEQKQMHGIVTKADQRTGFVIDLEGKHEGEIFKLPPDTRSFKTTPPGEYREISTGDIVINPDFMCSWDITRPARPHI